MTEEEARHWVRERFGVSRETQLERFVALLTEHGQTQNLVSISTLVDAWTRHIVDSAQLTLHAPATGKWLDIGSGAGLPGIVIAALRDVPVELVESRRLRTDFLSLAASTLGLSNVNVITDKIERTRGIADVITARAVTNLDQLFRIAGHRADRSTLWILPKGRHAHVEVEVAKHSWHGTFHVEPSITAPDSLIVIAREVRPK